MRRTLLATAAAAALVAAPGLAAAQTQHAPASDVRASEPAPAAQQRAPAEKMAPASRIAPENRAGKVQDRMPGAAQRSGAGMSGSATGETTGQGRSDAQQLKSEPRAPDPSGQPRAGQDGTASPQPGAQRQDQSPRSQGAQAPAQQQTTGQAGRSAAGATVNLTADQRTKIRTTVIQSNSAPTVQRVNFALSVGTVVPRTVRLVAVPAPLIEIHPAWRGFLYFVVGDRIVIVEPGTLRIVTVIAV